MKPVENRLLYGCIDTRKNTLFYKRIRTKTEGLR